MYSSFSLSHDVISLPTSCLLSTCITLPPRPRPLLLNPFLLSRVLISLSLAPQEVDHFETDVPVRRTPVG